MQSLVRLSLLGILLGGVTLHAQDKGSSVDPHILARICVPNRVIPQGEVRLVRRGGTAVVQTVLQTRFGKRVMNRITHNELRNWGDHRDAASYIDALEDAFAEYEKLRSAEGKQMALVIDFVDSPVSARVEFSFSMASHEKHGFDIQPSATWRSLTVSRDYLRKDQEYILTNSFKKGAAETLDYLHRLRTGPESLQHE